LCWCCHDLVWGSAGQGTPGQLLWMVLLEVPIYAINQKLVFDVFKALDIGEEAEQTSC